MVELSATLVRYNINRVCGVCVREWRERDTSVTTINPMVRLPDPTIRQGEHSTRQAGVPFSPLCICRDTAMVWRNQSLSIVPYSPTVHRWQGRHVLHTRYDRVCARVCVFTFVQFAHQSRPSIGDGVVHTVQAHQTQSDTVNGCAPMGLSYLNSIGIMGEVRRKSSSSSDMPVQQKISDSFVASRHTCHRLAYSCVERARSMDIH